MSREARTRAAVAALLALVAGGALAFGQVSGTFAIFAAETENQNAVAQGSWIPAPSGTSSAAGAAPYSTIALTWTSGNSAGTPSPNPVTGQDVYYADGGSGGSASCGAYSAFKTEAAAATSDAVTGTNLTDWWCFEVRSTSTQASTSGTWTSAFVTFPARQIFVLTGFSQNNKVGGTVGKLENGDQIVLTFNQNRGPIGGGDGNVDVRVCNSGSILVSTVALTCSGTPDIGSITGQTISTNRNCSASTTAGNGTTTLTITLASCGGNSTVNTGTATFTPTGTGLAASNGTNLCSSGASPVCTVTTATHY